MAAITDDECAFDGCDNEAAPRSAWCWGHLKQRSEGRPMTALRIQNRDPWDVVLDAALNYADANAGSAGDWKRARDRLRIAVDRYAASKRATSSNKSRKVKVPSQ